MISYQYLIVSDGDQHPEDLKDHKSKYAIHNPTQWTVTEICHNLVNSSHKNINEFPMEIEIYRNNRSKGVFRCGLMIEFEAEKIARSS